MLIRNRLSKLRAELRARFLGPTDWDEESYLFLNPDVKAAVERGDLSSGLEHWHRRGRFEGRMRSSGVIERRPARSTNVPKWLKNEMQEIAEIEPKLFPSKTFCTAAAEFCVMKETSAGTLYSQLLAELGGRSFTHVFLVPWLKTGGVELEALHHINTLAKTFGRQILVIITENFDSPWLSRLAKDTAVLDFAKRRAGIQHGNAQTVLARLLLKIKPAVIHNANSAIGWQIFTRYGAALASESRLYCLLPCFDYTQEGEPVGYARELEKAYPYLDGVFCDNQAFVRKLIETYGISTDLFAVIRYPVRVVPRFRYVANDQPKILWASRLDRQKRPDVLQKIAESLPQFMFHVYGVSPRQTSRELATTFKALRQLKNVIMFGEYDGFEAIPTANYALFLYTSQWDGMPNVILEAMASGLAVLAPNVGGIGDVIPPESGFLIPRFDDVSRYVDAIRRVTENPQLIFAERNRAMQLLCERYSSEAFVASLAKLPAYILTKPLPKGEVNSAVAFNTIQDDNRMISHPTEERSIGLGNSD